MIQELHEDTVEMLRVDTLADFQAWVRERWKREPRPNDLAIQTIGLSGESGEVVEEVLNLIVAISKVTEPIKKDLRGSAPVNVGKLILELGDVQHYLCAIANHYHISMSEVLEANIKKLEKRDGNGPQGESR